MTKKIFCIVLALMMIATVFLTGCKDTIEDKPENSAVGSYDSSEEASITDSSEEASITDSSEEASIPDCSEETSELSSEETKDFSNEEAREYLQKVLEKEKDFTYKCLVWGKVTTENFQRFIYNLEHTAFLPFIPQGYAYIDFDSDGIDELLIVDIRLTQCMVLRYDGEKAIGYIIEHINIKNVKTDGTLLIGNEKSACSISKVSFDGLDYEITNLAYKKGSENLYQLDQKPASKDEVENYFDNWNEGTTNISWTMIEL